MLGARRTCSPNSSKIKCGSREYTRYKIGEHELIKTGEQHTRVFRTPVLNVPSFPAFCFHRRVSWTTTLYVYTAGSVSASWELVRGLLKFKFRDKSKDFLYRGYIFVAWFLERARPSIRGERGIPWGDIRRFVSSRVPRCTHQGILNELFHRRGQVRDDLSRANLGNGDLVDRCDARLLHSHDHWWLDRAPYPPNAHTNSQSQLSIQWDRQASITAGAGNTRTCLSDVSVVWGTRSNMHSHRIPLFPTSFGHHK